MSTIKGLANRKPRNDRHCAPFLRCTSRRRKVTRTYTSYYSYGKYATHRTTRTVNVLLKSVKQCKFIKICTKYGRSLCCYWQPHPNSRPKKSCAIFFSVHATHKTPKSLSKEYLKGNLRFQNHHQSTIWPKYCIVPAMAATDPF